MGQGFDDDNVDSLIIVVVGIIIVDVVNVEESSMHVGGCASYGMVEENSWTLMVQICLKANKGACQSLNSISPLCGYRIKDEVI